MSLQVAWRYLWSRKRHGAVGVITWISVAGVAVATAATICVLSVFNGFQQMMEGKLELLSPDALIAPASQRLLPATAATEAVIARLPQVEAVCPVVTDRALAVYNGQEMPVRLMGVDTAVFRSYSAIDSLLIAGKGFGTGSISTQNVTEETTDTGEGFSEEDILAEELGDENPESAVVSAGVGMRLGIDADGTFPLSIIVPKREGTVNVANPAASLQMEDMAVGGIYRSLQSDYDKDYVLVPVGAARRLLSVPDSSASSFYVYGKPGVTSHALAAALRNALPDSFVVKDRLQQHESQFRMSNIEKWITYLLLSFILLIASFNLISSLAMLVIDKQENLGVLATMGATRLRIGSIFAWESGFITLIGGIAGILAGIALVMMQQSFGIIRLNGDPGTLILSSYPVSLEASDLLAVAVPLAVIGIFTAWLTARFARSRILVS